MKTENTYEGLKCFTVCGFFYFIIIDYLKDKAQSSSKKQESFHLEMSW